MSDYSKTTNFTAKDNLTTGNALKVVKGSYFDTEFDAIATASATKYDSGNVASQAEAEALTLDSVLITPHSLNDVLVDNGGMAKDIQQLADPGADRIIFWDDSAGAATVLTVGTGLAIGTTTLTMSHLGFENLVDPNADGIVFWDDSASKMDYLLAGNGLEFSVKNLQITDSAVSSSNPIGFTSGAPVFDASSLTQMEGSALAATDIFIVEDGGAPKRIEVQDMGLRVQTGQGTQTVAAPDMNSIMEFTGTATLTLPINSGVDLPIGVPIVLNVKHATQVLTVTAATSVTLVSVWHPGGGSAASDVLAAGGTAILFKTAADVWVLSGDTTT